MGYISVLKHTGIFSLCVLFKCIIQVSDLESHSGSNTQTKVLNNVEKSFPGLG